MTEGVYFVSLMSKTRMQGRAGLGRFLIYQCKDEFICLHAFGGGTFFFRLKIQGNECVRACESMCVRERDYKGDASMFPQA